MACNVKTSLNCELLEIRVHRTETASCACAFCAESDDTVCPLDELFTPHWSCWKRLYRFAENNLTMRLLTRRKLLMELLMRLLTATAQG